MELPQCLADTEQPLRYTAVPFVYHVKEQERQGEIDRKHSESIALHGVFTALVRYAIVRKAGFEAGSTENRFIHS